MSSGQPDVAWIEFSHGLRRRKLAHLGTEIPDPPAPRLDGAEGIEKQP